MKNFIGSKYLLVLVSLLSANPRAWADTLEFANGKAMQTEDINPQETANNFQYGIVKVNYTAAPVTHFKLKDQENYKILPEALFVSDAHAAIVPIDQNVFTAGQRAHEALRSALRFEDVRPFLTDAAYQELLSKRKDGSKDLLVLELIKTTIPDKIDVIQTQIKGDFAWAVARGKMKGQDFWGTLTLTRENGQWKLMQEAWYGNQSKPVVIKNMREAQDFITKAHDPSDNGFVQWIDKAGRSKSTLPLEYGQIKTPKNSFCFFFFLNQEKHKGQNGKDQETIITAVPSPDMHLVWPTSGVRHDPQVYKHSSEDGFDVSVASDKDGYYPNKMNLRLPGEKPREVYVGFLMSF